MITDSLSSSGRRRRRKSWVEISHALIEIRVVSAEATLDNASVSAEGMKFFFFPFCFSPAPPSPLKSFFLRQFLQNEVGAQKRLLSKWLLYIWDVSSSLAPWPQTVLSGRNGTTLPKGPLNLCLIQAAFWDSSHPYLASHATSSQLYWVKKKKSIITKGTTESNSLLSLWIAKGVRFPTNSDKTSPRELSSVTQLYLEPAGQAEPRASPQVLPGSHRPSRIPHCSEDVRASSDRKASLPPRNRIKYAGSCAGWRGTLMLFSSFLGDAAAVPRGRWGHCKWGWQSPAPATQKQGRSHPFFSLLWEKISTNLIDCMGLQSSITVKRLLFPRQLNNPNSTKRGGNEKIRQPTFSHSFSGGKTP